MSWETYYAKGFGGSANGSTMMIGQKMLTNERLEEMMAYLAGGCHIGGIQAAVENAFDCELTDEEFDQLEKFLEDNDCYECDHCGWQTHPGEGCDCENDDECPDCGNLEKDCECDNDN